MEGELRQLTKRIEKLVSEHRTRRDEWNTRTVENRTRRDQIGGKKRELFDEIQRQRVIRDEGNESVKSAKIERDKGNLSVAKAKEQLQELRGDEADDKPKGPNIHSLRKKLDEMERDYETGRFGGGKKEKEAIDAMRELDRQIKKLKTMQEDGSELSMALQARREAIETQEVAHQKVVEEVEMAQKAHELMLELRVEVNRLTELHEEAHQAFVDSKLHADSEHRRYIIAMRIVYGIRYLFDAKEARTAGREPTRVEARVEVQDLMSKLMSGETLSTEELMGIHRDED
uniref:Putative phosphoserine phosphatase n=1 Tax=uncultured marine group II/III euryarchaeote KM3_64_C08 TaxID=1456479 RepID=A0A075HIW3_9EURY|nr:putative phosphoserine phosphatase [uncultured marine group II/III euryarchaeote KM3_64_C08]